ncbi:glycosyltransferase family 39 protein [Maricaulaceae bacterium NA33B04]|nr:glycosyltransferase family 39 protein [Maricaulaceae bacterium NA33B04]
MMRRPGLLNSPVAGLIVALLALTAAAVGLFATPVLDRDEARFAQATAQMIESGDLVEISFLDQPRNKKPVGIHWLQAIAVQATTGEEAREIWAYRLPSVLGAILTALAAYFAGSRLFSRGVGFAGASLIAVSVLLAAEGGIAKTDSMLGATAAGAFLALVLLRTEPSARLSHMASLLFWVSLGLGALIKGPVTPIAAFLAIGVLFALERRFDWARPLLWWPGPVLAGLIVLPWLIAIQLATGGAFLMEAVGDDMGTKVVTGDEGHDGPPGYHLVLISVLFAPAILTLPAGVRALVINLRRRTRFADAARTVIAFALPTWMVFELLPTKLPHYTLPTYAALGVIAGLGLMRLHRTPALWRWLGGALGLFGFFIAAPGIAGFAVIYGGHALVPAITATGVVCALALLAIIFTGLGKRWTMLVFAVLAGLSWHIGFRGGVIPGAEDLFISRDTAAEVITLREGLSQPETVSTFTEPSFVFDLGGEVALIDPADLSQTEIDPAAPRLYVIDESRWLRVERGELSGEDEARRRAWLVELQQHACAAEATQGVNYSRGDDVINVFIFVTGCEVEPPADTPQDAMTENEAQP